MVVSVLTYEVVQQQQQQQQQQQHQQQHCPVSSTVQVT
jgi:hypothetical protein